MSTIHGEQLRDGTVANSALATDPLARANHTGTQLANTILNFDAAVRAEVEAELVAGANVTLTSSGVGAGRQITLSVTLPTSGNNYLGVWNANTNSPSLASGVGNVGDYYIVGTAGATNVDGITDWGLGDWIVFSSTNVWQKIDNSDAISTVFGRVGAIVAVAGDYTATQITFTPSGSITATNVQAAIQEVRDESLLLSAINTWETPSGAVNGANTVYVAAQALVSGRYIAFRNGVAQEPTDDFTLSSATLTFASAPKTGDKIRIMHLS